MSAIRLISSVLVSLSAGLLLGCPGTEAENPPSGSAGAGGVGGTGGMGGMGGAGGMTTSSSGAGGTPMCTDYGDVEETQCNLLAQDCDGPNESCRPNGLGTGTSCEPGGGIKGKGASCTSESGECAPGLYCVFGYCSPICCRNEPEPFCGSAQCSVFLPFGDKVIWTCNFAKTCTLFDGKECPENQQCRLSVPTQDLPLCAPTVSGGAPVPEGQPCNALNECGADQRCETVNNVKSCRYTCLRDGWDNLLPGEGGCPMGQTCQALPETMTYGYCYP